MQQKTPRPVASFKATRAGSEFLGGPSDHNNIILNIQTLASALRAGATVSVGRRRQQELTLDYILPILRNVLPLDDDERVRSLAAPFVFCYHWLSFTGRRFGLSRRYPVTALRELITTCFGLDHHDIPLDAVLAGLVAQEFEVDRKKVDGFGLIWVTNIRSEARVGYDRNGISRKVPLNKLGIPGSLPPFVIGNPPR
jgi:hypothetical protein